MDSAKPRQSSPPSGRMTQKRKRRQTTTRKNSAVRAQHGASTVARAPPASNTCNSIDYSQGDDSNSPQTEQTIQQEHHDFLPPPSLAFADASAVSPLPLFSSTPEPPSLSSPLIAAGIRAQSRAPTGQGNYQEPEQSQNSSQRQLRPRLRLKVGGKGPERLAKVKPQYPSGDTAFQNEAEAEPSPQVPGIASASTASNGQETKTSPKPGHYRSNSFAVYSQGLKTPVHRTPRPSFSSEPTLIVTGVDGKSERIEGEAEEEEEEGLGPNLRKTRAMSRSKPRSGVHKEVTEEELTVWNQIAGDLKKLAAIQKRSIEIGHSIVELEKKMQVGKASVKEIDELQALYRENIRLSADEKAALTEEPSDVLQNLEILLALRRPEEPSTHTPNSSIPGSRNASNSGPGGSGGGGGLSGSGSGAAIGGGSSGGSGPPSKMRRFKGGPKAVEPIDHHRPDSPAPSSSLSATGGGTGGGSERAGPTIRGIKAGANVRSGSVPLRDRERDRGDSSSKDAGGGGGSGNSGGSSGGSGASGAAGGSSTKDTGSSSNDARTGSGASSSGGANVKLEDAPPMSATSVGSSSTLGAGASGGTGAGAGGSSLTEGAKGPSAERAGKFVVGAEVAFKQPKPREDGSQWIQCNITSVVELGGNKRRYEVQDPEPDENTGAPGQSYRASAAAMIAIPQRGDKLPDFPIGKAVLARYPDTTTFYRAEITAVLRDEYKLRFEDDQNQESKVDRRFVLDVR